MTRISLAMLVAVALPIGGCCTNRATLRSDMPSEKIAAIVWDALPRGSTTYEARDQLIAWGLEVSTNQTSPDEFLMETTLKPCRTGISLRLLSLDEAPMQLRFVQGGLDSVSLLPTSRQRTGLARDNPPPRDIPLSEPAP